MCVGVGVRVRACACVCVRAYVSVKYMRPNGWTDHDQIWHAYANISGKGSYVKKLLPRMGRKGGLIGATLRSDLPTPGGRSGNFRGSKNKRPGNCRERYYIFNPHATGVGVFMGIGPTFQMSGTFHELSRKS